MIYEMLFNNPTLIIISMLTVNIFVFYALGAILQGYFSFRRSNSFLSIPLGYVSWQLLSLVLFSVPILFGLSKTWFQLLNLIKDIIIVFIIIMYYKSWAPSFKLTYNRSLLRAPIGIAITIISIILFTILTKHVPLNGHEDDLNQYINNMINGNHFIFDTGVGNSSNNFWNFNKDKTTLDIIENYESFYYWVALTFDSITSTTEQSITNYVIAPIMLIVISLSILGSIIDSEKSFISYLYGAILILIMTLLEWSIGVNSQIFYIVPILTLSVMLLFTYSAQTIPSEGVLTVSLSSLLALITVTYWAMPLIIIFGACIISLSVIKNGQIIKMMFQYVMALSLPIVSYSIISLLSPLVISGAEANLGSHLLTLSIAIIMFSLLLIPLKSLYSSSERRQDLVSLEEKVKNKKIISLISTALIITLIAFALTYLLMGRNIISLVSEYFTAINNNIWIALAIYVLVALLPAIVILVINRRYNYSSMLDVIPFLVFLINPITTVFFFESTGWEYNWKIIFIPELIIFILWILGQVIKFTPDKLKI